MDLDFWAVEPPSKKQGRDEQREKSDGKEHVA
jgi:hypothetical protein